ncbi:MAG TPA: carbohydrate kinase family protein [Anaerolineaceae bacterium]|nr:carbohydrate kinase family protein [Anaerolineaceae bacterium]
MSIFITGSVAFDYLMTFPGYFRQQILPDKLDKISLSFLVDSMTRQRGGCAPNIAYSLALLGERPKVFATTGQDFTEYRQWLESHAIDTRYIRDIPEKYTASFFVNTDLENNQIASFYTGAMADASQLSLKDTQPGEADYVVISPNDPAAMRKLTEECIELKIPYLFDPSQQVARNPHEDLKLGVESAHAVFCNEYEFELLKKHTGLSGRQIDKYVSLMVVTRGENGATVKSDEKEYHIPIVPADRIADPTGVGDAFRGGFLRGYRLGLDLQTCGQMGALSATYCLEQKGTTNHTYKPEEYIARYRQHFDDQGALDVLIN